MLTYDSASGLIFERKKLLFTKLIAATFIFLSYRDRITFMITIKELEHLATLARIKLTEDDKKSLVREFDSILGYIDQLKKVDVSLENENRVGAVKNISRPDEVQNTSSQDRERLLKEAPQRVGDFIAVKKIFARE